MTRLREPFETLDPPAGGLVSLRHRLRRSETRLRRRAIAISAGIAAAAAVCIALLATVDAPLSPPPQRAEIPQFLTAHPAAIALGIADDQTEPVVATGSSAAMRVDTGDDDVVFYLVAAGPAVTPSPTPASDPASREDASPH